MLEENKNITYTGEEIIEVLKEIELIAISLHQMGTYYRFLKGDKEKNKAEYEKETTRFIDEWNVERAMEGLKYWTKPNDKP